MTYIVEINNVEGAANPQSYTLSDVKDVGDNPAYLSREAHAVAAKVIAGAHSAIVAVNGDVQNVQPTPTPQPQPQAPPQAPPPETQQTTPQTPQGPTRHRG